MNFREDSIRAGMVTAIALTCTLTLTTPSPAHADINDDMNAWDTWYNSEQNSRTASVPCRSSTIYSSCYVCSTNSSVRAHAPYHLSNAHRPSTTRPSMIHSPLTRPGRASASHPNPDHYRSNTIMAIALPFLCLLFGAVAVLTLLVCIDPE